MATERPCLSLSIWPGSLVAAKRLDGVERPTDLILNPDKPGPSIDLPKGAPKTDLERILKALGERMHDLAKAEGNGLILQETEMRHKASLDSWKGKKVVFHVEVQGVHKRYLQQRGMFRQGDEKYLEKGQEPPWVVAVKPALAPPKRSRASSSNTTFVFASLIPMRKCPFQ